MTNSREKFEAWYSRSEQNFMAPILEPIAYAAWIAGRESMRDEATWICSAVHLEFTEHPEMALTCREKIQEIQP